MFIVQRLTVIVAADSVASRANPVIVDPSRYRPSSFLNRIFCASSTSDLAVIYARAPHDLIKQIPIPVGSFRLGQGRGALSSAVPPSMPLKPSRIRSQWPALALALILALLIAAWLALPALLNRLLPQLPALAGWSVQAAEFSGIGQGGIGLKRLRLHYAGPNGERLELDMEGLRADYALLNRHLDRLQIDQLRLSWQAGQQHTEQAWPHLDWATLPWSEVRIDRLIAAIELDPARRWQIEAGLRARQSPDGRIKLQARMADERFLIDFRPGEPALAVVTWRSGDMPDPVHPVANLYVTYAISNKKETRIPIKNEHASRLLKIRGEFSATAVDELTARLQWQARSRIGRGRFKLDAEIRLGPKIGQWEAITARIEAQKLKLLMDQSPTPIGIDLNGALQLHARPESSRLAWRVELLPGLQLHAKPLKSQAWAVETQLEKPLSLASDSQTVTGSLPLNLRLDGWNPLSLTLDRLRLAIGQDLAPRALAGRLRLPATSLRSGWPALPIDAEWHWQDRQLSAQGHVDLGREELLRFDIHHEPSDTCTTAEFKHQGDLVQLDRLFVTRPHALRPLRLQGGRSEGALSLRVCSDGIPVVHGALKLHQTALSWDQAQANGLDLELTLKSLDPISGQLEFGLERLSLAAGVELSSARLGLGWDERRLALRRFEAGLFDGRLSTIGQELELPPAPGRLALDAVGLDLARLLAAIDLNGLSGSGRLSGRLPLVWSDAGIEIRGGRLASTGPGLLRYQPATPMSDNPGLQALRNFHYSRLDLEIDYAANGDYRLRLKLDGNNPDLYDGHPIAFKLDLNGRLPGLFQGALLSGNFDAYLLEQLQRGKLE